MLSARFCMPCIIIFGLSSSLPIFQNAVHYVSDNWGKLQSVFNTGYKYICVDLKIRLGL